MSWQDFDADSALQRDTLGRALPLVETQSAEDWGDRINMADPEDPGLITVLVDPIVNGTTPASCIDLLQLRPLLFGTAWTVLDLLLEEALTAAGATPQSGRRWSIREKARQARASAGRPTAISARSWQALTPPARRPSSCGTVWCTVRCSSTRRRRRSSATTGKVAGSLQ